MCKDSPSCRSSSFQEGAPRSGRPQQVAGWEEGFPGGRVQDAQRPQRTKEHWGCKLSSCYRHPGNVLGSRCVCVLVVQSSPTLWNPMDCSPPGSSVHGILQTRTLEWVAIPSSRGSSQPRYPTQVSCIAGRFFTIWDTRKSQDLGDWSRGTPRGTRGHILGEQQHGD